MSNVLILRTNYVIIVIKKVTIPYIETRNYRKLKFLALQFLAIYANTNTNCSAMETLVTLYRRQFYIVHVKKTR